VPGLIVKDWFGSGTKAPRISAGSANIRDECPGPGRRQEGYRDRLKRYRLDQIPVHQIEKIEVLRGGSGSVLYGDNAQAA